MNWTSSLQACFNVTGTGDGKTKRGEKFTLSKLGLITSRCLITSDRGIRSKRWGCDLCAVCATAAMCLCVSPDDYVYVMCVSCDAKSDVNKQYKKCVSNKWTNPTFKKLICYTTFWLWLANGGWLKKMSHHGRVSWKKTFLAPWRRRASDCSLAADSCGEDMDTNKTDIQHLGDAWLFI